MLSSSIGAAPYCELALFHKKAKVLIVTDAVVYIPEDPPEVRTPFFLLRLLQCLPAVRVAHSCFTELHI